MALGRGIGLVLFLIGGAIFVSAAGMMFAWLVVGGGEPTVRADSTLVMRLQGDLNEVEPGGVLRPILQRRLTLRSVVETLHRARSDRRITSLMFVPASSPGFWGKTQELRNAVLDFKTSKKPVVALLEYGGEREYFLATAADKVFLLPTSTLDLKGLASYEVFLRGSLDKIGTYPDLLHIGDYKTAVNTWTQSGYTPAHREMAESLNREAFDQLLAAVAEGRRKTVDEVRALVDQGPFLPEEALRAGLIDDVAYEDQVDDKVKLGPTPLRTVEMERYAREDGAGFGFSSRPRVAVVYAVGMIVSGRSGQAPQGDVVGSGSLVETIRTVRDDNSVKAVVLRIDSPGGSSIASDVIWRELMLTRARKPLVASMSDLAASGGYYIAMPAHTIVAQPGTLTGSIGIFGGKFVIGGTAHKLGANIDGVIAGRNADINSPVRPYSPEERAKLEAQLEAFYDQFVEKVAEARKSTPERIDAIAQGRVWTGRQAKELGLVDDLGGLDRAIALARKRAGLPADAEIVVYPPRRSLYEMMSDPFGGEGAIAGPSALGMLGPEERRIAATLLAPLRLFRAGEPLALMPNLFLR